ncbi:MAG: site-2 protease family protein [Ignavibacteriae bacterium HGW-Ignavibacteriae-3]|nr:MAG: site-2 protease family protein [Ignavibacteriae bacterium HGW-Ignavibacteriae-3]
MEWTTGKAGPFELTDFYQGLPYTLSILFILGVHEFGHYFAAVYHKVKVTLPYFIPFPPIPGFINFGTMGAVIKTKSVIPTNKAMFDIGVAGPVSGFIACLLVLIYGFTNLPGQNYLLQIHPDYFSPEYGKNAIGLEFGNTLLFVIMKNIFVNPSQFFPPMSEIYHYPYLCVGWFGLFVTAMNLIPVGQLDGGHIIYSMFDEKKQEAIASISMIILIVLGVVGVINPIFNLGLHFGWSGWLFWALILYFFIKVKHPPVQHFEELSPGRKMLGYAAILIFILSFSPTPLILSF